MHFFVKTEFFRAKTTVYGTKTRFTEDGLKSDFRYFTIIAQRGNFMIFMPAPPYIKRR